MRQAAGTRVLLVAPQPFFQERGTPIAVLLAARTLCEAGYLVDLLAFREGRDVEVPNLTLLRAPKPPFIGPVPIGFSWRKLACDAPLAARLLSLARSGRYRILHAVEEAIFPAATVARACGLKLVYDMDSSMADQLVEKWPRLAMLRSVLDSAERWAVRRADVVLPVCQALADKAARHAPGKPTWIVHDVVGDGAKPARPVEDLRARFARADPLVLYVGNLEEYQGMDLLLRAFARTSRGILAVIGGHPRDVEAKRALAAGLGLGSRVRFLGPRPLDDLPAYLAQADVLASPRLRGVNTPMKVYSYMAAGKAICATDIASHRQALDMDSAALASPEPDAYGRALQALLDDVGLRARLGAAARQVVRTRFSYELYRDRLVAAYRSLEKPDAGPAADGAAAPSRQLRAGAAPDTMRRSF